MASESLLELMRCAESARGAAYAPYSRFKVGAAVRVSSGQVYTGCNVENASYGLAVCAERVAIFKAISAGEKEIRQLAVCADGEAPAMPCGACRQVLWEFGRQAEVVVANPGGEPIIETAAGLLPRAFRLEQ